MYDGASLSDPSLLQRAIGELRVVVKRFGPETVLDELRQVGCLKARFPRRIVSGWMDVVMLNTGGGVAGGDRLDLAIAVGAGAQATIAAQAAERFYRARAGDAPSSVRTRLTVADRRRAGMVAAGDDPVRPLRTGSAAGGRSRRGCAFPRRRDAGVRPHGDGRAGAAGLAARSDPRAARRRTAAARRDPAGWRDRCGCCSGPPSAAAPCVVATMVYVAPDAGRKIGLRCVHGACANRVEAAASAWNGMLIARILGPDSAVGAPDGDRRAGGVAGVVHCRAYGYADRMMERPE